MRKSPSVDVTAGVCSYIESKRNLTQFSCSFVEFDGRGDFLNNQLNSKIQLAFN